MLLDQLFAILDAVPNHGVRLDISKQVVTDLEELYSRASSIIDKSKRAVQQSDPTYYQKMGQIIEKPVEMVHAYKLVDRTLQWQETQANTVGKCELARSPLYVIYVFTDLHYVKGFI